MSTLLYASRTEEPGTTVDAPVCPVCLGAMHIRPVGAPDGEWECYDCTACDATGYERGDNASLLAMVDSLAELHTVDDVPVPRVDLIGQLLAEESAI